MGELGQRIALKQEEVVAKEGDSREVAHQVSPCPRPPTPTPCRAATTEGYLPGWWEAEASDANGKRHWLGQGGPQD